MLYEASASTQSNFQLKNTAVDLIGKGVGETATLSIEALEAMRTERAAVPASKHGLEAICGASCETGAQ
jgi:hypothetical protein